MRPAGDGRRRQRRDLLVAALAWALLTGGGELAVQFGAVENFPFLASREGAVSDDAIIFLLRLLVPVFMFVAVAVFYGMLRFRVRPGDTADSQVQRRTHRGFAWTWLAVTSAFTVTAIVHPGVTGLLDIWKTNSATDPLVVNVTAKQWEWQFEYPAYRVVRQKTLVLPVDRPVKFVLRSEDVIHSFWVPAFRIKWDAVPGMTRYAYLTPDRLGSTQASPLLRVQCAELCGVGHAQMNAPLRIVTGEQFAQWARYQAAHPPPEEM
jgi:cytochrome c oxidase subunit 2